MKKSLNIDFNVYMAYRIVAEGNYFFFFAFIFFFFNFKFYFIFKLYITVLVLPNIKMKEIIWINFIDSLFIQL